MILYEATFKKKNNELRYIRFVKLKDLPVSFLSSHIKQGSLRVLQENLELVWDYDKNEFRTFNWKEIIGSVTESVIDKLQETN